MKYEVIYYLNEDASRIWAIEYSHAPFVPPIGSMIEMGIEEYFQGYLQKVEVLIVEAMQVTKIRLTLSKENEYAS